MSFVDKLKEYQDLLFDKLDYLLNTIAVNELHVIIASSIFAVIPVIIWLYIFLRKSENSKKVTIGVFLIGCLTAPFLLGIQYLWEDTTFDIATFIESNIKNQKTMWVAMFMLFAAMEEIIKLYVVRFVDKTTTLITKINDAIKFSIISALGFSFIENVWYLYSYWPLIGTPYISNGDLLGMYFFRSVFTACAHMIFSGVFGYFYGVGKFSMVMTKAKKLTGGTSRATQLISKIFRLPLEEGFRQKVVVKGLFIAIFMHVIFNYLLQYNIIPPVVLFVICGYIYLKYLLNRKAGHLVLAVDPKTMRPSSMAKNDEEVVVELMGMWFKEEKFVDVLHMCQRLLERDPDNEVVKLFKAQALDEIEEGNPYKEIINTVIKGANDLSASERSTINKYTEEKEMFQKVKTMIQEELEKQHNEKEEFHKAQEKITELLKKQGKDFKNPLDKE